MIKYIISSLAILTISFQAFSQVKDYDQTALLFGQEKLNGTARFTSMSGAFGALGGDLSAAEINPAGMAIFNNNAAAITVGINSITNNNSFYNMYSQNKGSTLNIEQGGANLIFDNNNSKWSKFSVSGNVSISNNFDETILLKGNNHTSSESYFLEPDPDFDLYNNVEEQKINNATIGNNTKFTITISTKYNKSTYFGISLINNSIEYDQINSIYENSVDPNNNTFSVNLNQDLKIYGQGVGFNFGIIKIPMKNLRLGLSFQTPTWYSLTEEFNENTRIDISNADINQPNNQDWIWEYQLKTPSKTTGSIAYIFGKQGLLSLDYSYKDYSKTKLTPINEFEKDFNYNKAMNKEYTNVSTLNIGGEFRLKLISLRAGYHYETSPYKNNNNEEYFTGYSFGLGFKTSQNSKLDFTYSNNKSIDKNLYLNNSNYIITNNDTNKFIATYSINF